MGEESFYVGARSLKSVKEAMTIIARMTIGFRNMGNINLKLDNCFPTFVSLGYIVQHAYFVGRL